MNPEIKMRTIIIPVLESHLGDDLSNYIPELVKLMEKKTTVDGWNIWGEWNGNIIPVMPGSDAEQLKIRYEYVKQGGAGIGKFTNSVGAFLPPEGSISVELTVEQASFITDKLLEAVGEAPDMVREIVGALKKGLCG